MELDLEHELLKHFHFSTFRPGQKEIIQDVLNGKDVLGILPTGSGKSICYQLPAIIMDGLTIVVSPLISLMMDQVKEMKANHFKKVIAINSFMNFEERREIYRKIHTYKLLFISPELLNQTFIIKLFQGVKVSLFVIDEAHCISQWGHEFRPDYLKLSSIIEKLGTPPTLALSATATPEVQTDIITSLNKPKMVKHIYPMDKPNIAFCVERVENDQEKSEILIPLLKKYKIPTLIYFSSRLAAENFTRYLSENLQDRRVGFYHAGMEPMDRVMIQQQFMNNQLDIVCCTSAFGMGINKSNIRLIIHYHIPLQLESFIQEVGRAGRDGKSSVSLLLFSKSDMLLPNNLIKNELPDENILSNVFRYLRDLSLQDMDLPNDDVQIQNLLNLNETQWRFLRYQLEKHNLINGIKIMDYSEIWKDIYQSIFHVVKSRVKLKIGKLTEINKWIHEDKCLRDTLYQSFQPVHNGAEFQCCSNCGFTWSEWSPEQQEIESSSELNWENKLKKLLLLDNSR
ncbi:ATP-dependent DNA helicase RecQ [Oceanobacillus sp. Castelsardo]|uniref:RecQ family ATP-dependent DNA helicase n=1 Tax=Oceanobacillus sp. Castelsardo TaxID=1851204 RepID=UPI0008388516|nr:ATP-dependent DNA helicase RecQ [Oceanobacillus sp. Castelsardo]